MQTLPSSVTTYLCSRIVGERPFAYLLLDQNGKVMESGGNLGISGIDLSGRGWNVTDRLFFMEGLLPLDRAFLNLSHITLGPGVTTDAHLFRTETGHGLLLLNTIEEYKFIKKLQQQANDLVLLREKIGHLAGHSTDKALVENLQGLFPEKAPARRTVTILSAGIVGLLNTLEDLEPEHAARHIRNHSQFITRAVHVEGGFVDSMLGETLTSIFGLLPSTLPPAVQAIQASEKMTGEAAGVTGRLSRKSGVKLRIGIATGTVFLAHFCAPDIPNIGGIGRCVTLARRLEQQAPPGEVFIDMETFRTATAFQHLFQQITIDIPGISTPTDACRRKFSL